MDIRKLKAKRGESLTDWRKVDVMGDNGLDEIIVADDDERGFAPDWTKAELVLPESELSMNLRLDRDIVEFFKGQGRGHIQCDTQGLCHYHAQRHFYQT